MEEAIRSYEARRAVYVSRGALWAQYVTDCDCALALLRAGLPLSLHMRGIPS